MHFPIPLALLSLFGVWGVGASPNGLTDPHPWWVWSNITEPVVVLNPDELPYLKPLAAARRTRLIRMQTNALQSEREQSTSPLQRTAALLQPTTNVSESAANLRFHICCACLPEYACFNGHTSMENLSPDDFSLNYEICPYPGDFCCPLRDAPSQCQRENMKSVKRSVEGPKMITSKCECLHHELCPTDLVVKFNSNDSQYNDNNACSNEFEVCCSLSDLPPGGEGDGAVSPHNCLCVEETLCDNIVHLMGIKSEDYIAYLKSQPTKGKCSNSSLVCCSLPSTLPSTDDRLLFQTPAITYEDDALCHGYFYSEQHPVSYTMTKSLLEIRIILLKNY